MARSADIVLLQETRHRDAAIIESADYTKFLSPAKQGVGGVAIWIGKKTTLARGRNYVILAQAHDCLLIRFELQGRPLFVLSAHGPHSGYSNDDIAKWWSDLQHLLTRFDVKGRIIAGIDANAHFSFPIGSMIGSIGLEERGNFAAACFADLLTSCEAWLPASFSDTHYGITAMWRHPARGTWHRCDYVVLSLAGLSAAQSWVDANIDPGGANIDHLASFARLQIEWHGKSSKQHGTNCNLDLRKLRDASDATIQEMFSQLTTFPWEQNIHEHGAAFVSQLRMKLIDAFPVEKKPPRKNYISDATWEICAARRFVRRRIVSRKSCAAKHDCYAAFIAWRDNCSFGEVLNCSRGWELKKIFADLADGCQLRRLNFAWRKSIVSDRNAYIQTVSQSAAHLPPSQVIQQLRCIGVCGKKKLYTPKPLTTMVKADGTTALTAEELEDLWFSHFADMEDGVEMTQDELLLSCVKQQSERHLPCPTLNEVPSLLELENAFRANQYGKAVHHDGVPSDLCHRFAPHLARAFHHLALKQWICIQEPITYKGGVLIHVYKGRGSTDCCNNYRSLMVSSVLSKSLHRILRMDCGQLFDRYRLPLQLGGLPGRSVSQGSQSLICFAHSCRVAKQSMGVLFVDIRQAFYRLFREHIVATDDPDASVARLFATLKLPSESFHQFAEELSGQTAFEEAGAPPFLTAHVREAVSHTWFRLPRSARLARTRKGSRPGDNMADLLFAFAFKRLLTRVLDELALQGCPVEFRSCVEAHPYPQQLPSPRYLTFKALGPIWADDLAVMLCDAEPGRLLRKVTTVSQVLFERFALTGMDMNLQRGKTEVVLDLRGAGAKKIREDLNRVKPPTICVPTTTLGDIFITVVAKYKHLGTLFSHKGAMGPEIRSRLGQARADFQRLRKKLFNNHELPERTRIQLFHTLVLTGLMYNIAVWPPLMRRDEDKFACGIQSLYNSLALAIWGEDTLSWRYERTMARLSMPDGYTLMRVARLRYLQHLLHKADEFVWACVHLCPAWLNLLDRDFRWLQYHCPQEAPQEDPSADWAPWQALLLHGRAWVKLVKKAQKHCELQTKKNIDWDTWHRDALMILKDHKLWKDVNEVKLDGAHACLLCKQRFRTKAAWSVHAFRSHGRIAPHRRYAEGAHCVICRKVFQYHSALVNHIRYSDRCRQELQRRDMVAPIEPSIGSSKERTIRDNAICPYYAILWTEHT